MKKILICIFVFFFAYTANSQTWSTNFGDTLKASDVGYVPFMLHVGTYKHKLFIYGSFVRAGDMILNYYAMWHNYIWDDAHIYSNSAPDYSVKTSLEYNNLFYVGGDFFDDFNGIPGAQGVAIFNGSSWDKLHNDTLRINDMLWKDGNLYVGGRFNYFNGVLFGCVARWDGQQWNKLKNGFIYDNPTITSVTKYNGYLYFSGYGFGTIDGINPLYGIARWDGADWSSVGGGLGENVMCLVTDSINNYLYAGGQMVVVDDTTNYNFLIGVARWDGNQWTSMGEVGGITVNKLIMYRGELYAGGTFTSLGSTQVTGFAKWNGSSWEQVGLGIDNGVKSMCIFNDELILGGEFTQAGGMLATGLARMYMPPDSACIYFTPVIYTDADTFYLQNDTVSVQFYNNNSHANTWAWNFGDTGTDTVWCPVHVYNQPGVFTVNINVTELWCNKSAQKTVVISDLLNSQQPIANSQHPTALKIYPNPATGSITIEVTGVVGSPLGVRGNESNNELRITDQHGKIIKSYQITESDSKTEINTKGWVKGTYLCSLMIGKKTVKTEKLVIE